VRLIYADFAASAAEVPTASIVTLDRVVCCYPSYEPLLQRAVSHAERAFAFSYPRDRWYVRFATRVENALRALKCPFRTFVHSPARMVQIIEGAGFDLISRQMTFTGSVDVFARASQMIRLGWHPSGPKSGRSVSA
jgi:magnesium-protoporphyrin O-methyltransferase